MTIQNQTPPNTEITPSRHTPQKLRIVKIGSEGIAIKPDTGDLRTDMQTVAMCGLNEPLALMFAAAPDMFSALKELSAMHSHVWDLVDGGLVMLPDSIKRFEAAHGKAQAAIEKAEKQP